MHRPRFLLVSGRYCGGNRGRERCSSPSTRVVPKRPSCPSLYIKILRNNQARQRLSFRLLLPTVPPCLAHPSLSSPERDQDQHKAHRSILALSCFGEDILSSHGMEGWGLAPDRPMAHLRLDLGSRLKLELSHRRSLTSLSTVLGPKLPSVKWRKLSSHIPTDRMCAEPN